MLNSPVAGGDLERVVTDNPKQIRIGAVSYLNTKPLVYRLEERLPQARLSFDLPSRLAEQLARGELEVALIPSIEFHRASGYEIVSDACIACRGPVLSVKLLSRVPLEQIRTLALDEGSRTSVAMSRVFLREKYGVAPELSTLPIDADFRQTDTDAVLVIGDRAIHTDGAGFPVVVDLGEAWVEWRGLPFVFAPWVARKGGDYGEVIAALEAARDEGVLHLPEIAAAHCDTVQMSVEASLSYLRDKLYFYLGAEERRGLMQFFRSVDQLEEALTTN